MSSGDTLSPQALANLKLYKYSSVDKSFISNYVLRYYWNACVKLLPMWLAANMVTLLGFFLIIANVMLLQVTIPDLVGPGPVWVYWSFAFALWGYSTMDNIDGKQARRTGTSSPLGELFDHGIDSLNCTLASLLETAAMGFGPTHIGAFTAMVPVLPMFFSTWETYHTHTLYLGVFNGPTEGLIIATSIMAISGYYGPQVWQTPVSDLIGLENIFGDLSWREGWVPLLLIAFFTAHLPACVYHVVNARRAANLPVLPVFLEWTSMLIFCGSCLAWLGSPHSNLLKDNHLVLWCLTMSFVFGRLTTKIILCHLTRQPFPFFSVMLVPLIGGAVLAQGPSFELWSAWSPTTEFRYLQGYFVFAVVAYFTWAVRVINAICKVLEINCLTIKKRKVDADEADKGKKEIENETPAANGELRRSTRKKA
ncbi:Cholinephosphotransferase 1 [Cyphellophora attinorum]|uniref:Cholinephosphotransferase 1 n=1 Tax=Cyphellophora attinorum TaxID=1664694 RepID=A0A0N1NX68_9EURO|nr:Cholinephosphotransferase 1 [Phialophora attinorum]KPI36536.1 Cholinephosphotransferase 1 [Phialophora attinorum]